MADVTAVAERYALFQDGRFRTQHHLDVPLHSVNAVHVSDRNRRAAIRVLREGKINRRKRHPVVRYGKVVFDTKGRPGSAISDVRLLNRRISVEHRQAVDLVYAGVKVTTKIRQNRALQIFIFEKNSAPLMVGAAGGQIGPQSVGIVKPRSRELIKWRIRVRWAFVVGREWEGPLPDSHLRARRQCQSREQCQRRNIPSKIFHQAERYSNRTALS